MKKIMYLIIILLLFPQIVFADDKIKGEYGTYEDALELVQEVMKTYYIRGPFNQYNYAKTAYGFQLPENGTSQNFTYMVCAAFAYDLYTEAFGMSNKESADDIRFPMYNSSVLTVAREYYADHVNDNASLTSGNFLLYYKGPSDGIPPSNDDEDDEDEGGIQSQNTDNNINFTFNNSTEDINKFVKSIKPGDIFVYTGHVLVAYDVFQNDNGDWDVLLLNSVQNPYIPTRISSTSKISYNRYKNSNGNNNIIDVDEEGTIRWTTLRNISYFIKDNKLQCPDTDECAVIRQFYNDNGKAIFNYTISKSHYAKSKLRTEYPGLMIEKTVNKGTNNSVYVGDELEYTIKITNKSGVTYNPQTYNSAFTIEEELGDYVEYISSNGNYNNNVVKWNFSSLEPNATNILTYKVRVKNNTNNVSKNIEATGKFYKNSDPSVIIETGVVKNKIIPKVSNYSNTYKNCYNQKKTSFSGLELIDEIYKCAFVNKDLNLDDFDFSTFFYRDTTLATAKAATDKAHINENSEYKKMVLNNYWSAMVLYKSGSKKYTIIPRLTENLYPRAKSIYSDHFKEGDVLLYSIDYNNGPYESISFSTSPGNIHTKEDGLYAFIYIDGEFVGVNGSGETKRDEFNYNYYPNNSLNISSHLYGGYTASKLLSYSSDVQEEVLTYVNYQTLYDKDNYVILRPEMSIQELESIEIESLPIKTSYIQNYENLDLTGGKIKGIYNDGEKTLSLDNPNNNIEVTGFSNSTLGTKTITVRYGGKETSFNVEIISKQATKIEMKTNPTKTTYIQGYENLDLTGGIIKITYNDESTSEMSLTNSNVQVSGFSNSTLGRKRLTVTYNGLETSFNVEIVSKQVTGIEMKTTPTKTVYVQDLESLDLTGGIIKVTYNDESTSEIGLTNSNIQVSGFDNSTVGTKSITVTYNGAETSFDIEVISKIITKIEMKTNPTKTTYVQNSENLDLTGGSIKVFYNDTLTSVISLTNSDIQVTGFDNNILGIQNLTVTYNGFETSFDIEIITKQIVKIELKANSIKAMYEQNKDKLSLEDGILLIYYNDGTIDEVSLANELISVSGFDNSNLGPKALTIEYMGRTVQFDFEVVKPADINNPATGRIKLLIIITLICSILFVIIKNNKLIRKLVIKKS